MKKVIAIIAVITTISACFCIGANAYEIGDILPAGTVIVLNDAFDVTGWSGSGSVNNIYFSSNGNTYNKISYSKSTSGTNPYTIVDYVLSGSLTRVYNTNDGNWANDNYKTITLTEEYTVDQAIKTVILNNNVTSVTEPAPPPLEKEVNGVKTTFSATLFVGGLLISWLVANQICLVGLYLYIMIALAATGRRFIKGA